jgi:hypothetical protein
VSDTPDIDREQDVIETSNNAQATSSSSLAVGTSISAGSDALTQAHVVNPGARLIVAWIVVATTGASGTQFSLKRDTAVLDSFSLASGSKYNSVRLVTDTPPTGSYTYKITNTGGASRIVICSIVIFEVRPFKAQG